MIEEHARVVRDQGSYAWVEARRRSACEGCASGPGCGVAALARGLWRRPLQFRVLNRVGAREGEDVVVGLSERALVAGSLAVYLVPVASLLACSMLGRGLTAHFTGGVQEGWSVGAGVLGLVFGLLWTWHFGARTARDAKYQPVILRRAKG
jgi:sigma-E factor negative regulatory protein RseC